MTRIILTRHGHVEWIAPERFRGRADLPLTDRGVAQARMTSRRVEALGPVAVLYTSPMSRSVRTGQIIAEPFSLQAQPMAALIDIEYGEWQRLTSDESASGHAAQSH